MDSETIDLLESRYKNTYEKLKALTERVEKFHISEVKLIDVFNPFLSDLDSNILANEIAYALINDYTIGDLGEVPYIYSSHGINYFINVELAVVRNLALLLKITYPMTYKMNATLHDLYDCLTNFENVIPLVRSLKASEYAYLWKDLILYCKMTFFPRETTLNGKPIYGGFEGKYREKTEQAIHGLISYLYNFFNYEHYDIVFSHKFMPRDGDLNDKKEDLPDTEIKAVNYESKPKIIDIDIDIDLISY